MRVSEVTRLEVLFHGRSVGVLAMTDEHVMAFEYAKEWLDDGFSISPLSLPLQQGVFIARREPLDGLFGVFADSLPDGWGRLLVDRTLSAHGVDTHMLNPLTRLSIVGSSGMGALEYYPESYVPCGFGSLDLDELASACAEIMGTSYSEDLDSLFALGGSSGGARPKILTTVDGEEWIIKFPSSVDPLNIGRDEYKLAQLAGTCGIAMPETKLFPSRRCEGYFGVKRFDRRLCGSKVEKVHMVSAAGLLETSHRIPNLDYETLMRLSLKITGSVHDIEALYRLMCFNVFVGNRDDHSKNFSFIYNEDERRWALSPAYDITRNPGIYGEHATTVRGKGRNIGVGDLVDVGVAAGLSAACARSIADAIRESVQKAGVLEDS